MGGNDSWVYQGRQYHMWFGHGTKPPEAKLAAAKPDALPPLQDRIHSLGYTLAAGLPAAKRHHAVARFGAADRGRLARVMTGVVHAFPLGAYVVPGRVLGTVPEAPGVAAFVEAGRVIRAASSMAELREATGLVGRSAVEMGLDRFQPFLRQADEHLARRGGLATLVRDVTPPPAPVTVAPKPVPPAGPLMPLLGRVLRGAGWLALAASVLGALRQATYERHVREAVERFGLDPAKPEDAAAAAAYAHAVVNRALLIGTGLPEGAQEAVAEQVMRAVRSDPGLWDRAMEGDEEALAAVRKAVRRTMAPGFAYEVRDDEEREFVNDLVGQGKTGAEIQEELNARRSDRRRPTTEERRKEPGVVTISSALVPAKRDWLSKGISNGLGAPVPAQVGEELEGRLFASSREFREAFWVAVSRVPELVENFSSLNVERMRGGKAPFAPSIEIASRGKVFELHHDPALRDGGLVYDLSAIRVVTPRQHDAIHRIP